MNIIAEWLVSMIAAHESEEIVVHINGLNRCVTIREAVHNKDIRIAGCEDTYIYVDAPVRFVSVNNCVNCTLMFAAVSQSCSMDKCENVTICTATNFLRVANSVDCFVHCYTQISPPLIYGDVRSLVLAPHNAAYFDMISHLKNADITFTTPG